MSWRRVRLPCLPDAERAEQGADGQVMGREVVEHAVVAEDALFQLQEEAADAEPVEARSNTISRFWALRAAMISAMSVWLRGPWRGSGCSARGRS